MQLKKITLSSSSLNGLILSAGLLIGRLSGYIRELVQADIFGTSNLADIAVLSLTTPDLINNLISSGALSMVLLPHIQAANNKKDMTTVAGQVTFFAIFFMGIFFLAAPLFFSENILKFVYISILSILPNALTFTCAVFLMNIERFGLQSLGTLIFNIIFIVGLIFFRSPYLIAITVIFAALGRLLMFYKYAEKFEHTIDFKKLFRPRILFQGIDKLKPLLMAVFINGIIYLNPIIDKIMTAQLSDGSTAILSYSEKLYLLPVSILLTTFPLAQYPSLVKAASIGDISQINRIMKRTLLVTCSIGLFVAIVYFFFLKQIVYLVYGITSMNENDFNIITSVTYGYIGAIFLSGISLSLSNYLYAIKREGLVAIIAVVSVITNLTFNYWAIHVKESLSLVSYGTSLTALVYTFIVITMCLIVKMKDVKWN